MLDGPGGSDGKMKPYVLYESFQQIVQYPMLRLLTLSTKSSLVLRLRNFRCTMIEVLHEPLAKQLSLILRGNEIKIDMHIINV